MTHTNITHTTTLSRKEQEDIRRISALCRLTDGLSLSCPEDGDEYWLLEEDATAAAFLAVYKTEETMWECYAFTHPDFRRKGYFSALLEQVCQYSEALGEPELCLVTDNKCPAATAALRELGAELWNEEYMMEYNTAADSSKDGKWKHLMKVLFYFSISLIACTREANSSSLYKRVSFTIFPSLSINTFLVIPDSRNAYFAKISAPGSSPNG